jgi:hypothetical protein
MMGPSRRVASLIAITAAACAGDTTVDPGDLELRDLLGISPEIASAWNADQRAAARRVLLNGLADDAAPSRAAIAAALIDPAAIGLAHGVITVDERVARLLAAEDERRASARLLAA